MEDKIKYLNLYCGIGGNRELLGDNVNVTAVEINEDIANKYKKLFPNDRVIIADAHEYLLEHYTEFDFIWSSPPCPTHSRTNFFLHSQGKIRYPDLKLWQEIIFLKNFCKCKWVVENVIPYYDTILNPKIVGRHCFWSNFEIIPIDTKKDDIGRMNGKGIIRQKASKKSLEERNKVDSKLGKHIFNCAYGKESKPLFKFLPNN
jgi:DNA (cytosine-5)-methyltransferase 1